MSTVPFNRPRNVSSELAKSLPHNFDAERSVLGAILLDNSTLKLVAQHITAADFFEPKNSTQLSTHGRIYLAMTRLADETQPIEILSLIDQMKATGELAAYIGNLADGMPRVNNAEFYAKLVREKSLMRQLIYKTEAIQQSALDGTANYEELTYDIELFTKESVGRRKSSLIVVDVLDFLTMDVAPLEFMIEPILSVKGRGMIWAPRGAGKTFFTMQVAYSVSTGEPCFVWRVPKPRPVVYVDGEMHASELQDRQARLCRLNNMKMPERGYLRLITRDLQKDVRPKINSKAGRDHIEAHLSPGCLLVLDNLSALSPSSDEKETEDWALIEDWVSDLSWHGVSTIFVNHAGKSGDQRGTSKREDLLDFVLKLEVPSDHRTEEGLRAECQLTKLRRKPEKPSWGQPFEVSIGMDDHAQQQWLQKPLRDLLRDRARRMLADGMKEHDVVLETGLSRWTVRRLKKNFDTPGFDPEA